jgi:hypothetical protein
MHLMEGVLLPSILLVVLHNRHSLLFSPSMEHVAW